MSTNNTNFDAGVGIFWGQQGGNWFVGRCAITNYQFEGIQFGAGPAAVVANDYHTVVSYYATTAILAIGFYDTVTSTTNDYTFYVVGNRIVGGRFGYWERKEGSAAGAHSRPQFSGNYVELSPAHDLQLPTYDNAGAAFEGGRIEHANIAGNKLVAGAHGARW